MDLVSRAAVHGVPYQHMPEIDFFSLVSTAIFQLLEPDGVVCAHWLSCIDGSISNELTELFQHGLLLGWPLLLKNRKVS